MIDWFRINFSRCELFLIAILGSVFILGVLALACIIIVYFMPPKLPEDYRALPSNLCKPSFMCDR